MNLPNKITLSRICLIPLFVAIFYIDAIPYNHLISAGMFLLIAMTDFIDGHIARKYKLVTNMGKFLDPIADKILVAVALIMMVEKGCFPDIFGALGVSIILSRELIVSGFRMLAASQGIVIAADKTGKIKTVFQDISIAFILCFSVSTKLIHGTPLKVMQYIGFGLFGVAVLLTLVSGISYIIKNRQVFVDKKEE